MDHVPESPAGADLGRAKEEEVRLLPDLAVGSRFRVKSRGKYSRGLEGRTGTVLGLAHTRSTIRVLLDGQKRPQTLHRGYLQLITDPAT